MNTKYRRLRRRLLACLLLYIVPAVLGASMGATATSLAATFGLWPGMSRALRHPLGPTTLHKLMAAASAASTAAVAALICLVSSVLGVWGVLLWSLVAVEVAQRRVPRTVSDPSRWLMAY